VPSASVKTMDSSGTVSVICVPPMPLAGMSAGASPSPGFSGGVPPGALPGASPSGLAGGSPLGAASDSGMAGGSASSPSCWVLFVEASASSAVIPLDAEESWVLPSGFAGGSPLGALPVDADSSGMAPSITLTVMTLPSMAVTVACAVSASMASDNVAFALGDAQPASAKMHASANAASVAPIAASQPMPHAACSCCAMVNTPVSLGHEHSLPSVS